MLLGFHFPLSISLGLEAVIYSNQFKVDRLQIILVAKKYIPQLFISRMPKMRAIPQLAGAPKDNFRKNICSDDDLRSRIFGTFVVKFLAWLPLLGFSDI